MNLTGSVKIKEYKGVVVVKVDELLKKEGRRDFRFCNYDEKYPKCEWVLAVGILVWVIWDYDVF